MVARTIGGWLAARYAEIEARHRTGKPGPLSNETRLKIWVDYLEVLHHIKVLDLACGSGRLPGRRLRLSARRVRAGQPRHRRN